MGPFLYSTIFMEREKVKVLIIGSGPAGYTAAIYAARAGLNPVLYTGGQPGGQLTITGEVENYPGYPKGIDGPQMMMDLRAQAERFGTQVRDGIISKVDFSGYPLLATADETAELEAEAVIVATGASAKYIGLPSEQKFANKGVSACAVCDGFFFRGMDVAVIGAGDSAAEEASYLSKLCPKVYLVVRRDEMRASKIMQQRVKNNPKIEILWNTSPIEVLGNEDVSGMRVVNNKTGEKKDIPIKGFFVAIGHQPNTQIFEGQLDLDSTGYILIKPGSTRTNAEGVFAVGDAADRIYRQAVTAAGTGCMGALDAERFLAAREHHTVQA